jgi:uncharacterized membrane protein
MEQISTLLEHTGSFISLLLEFTSVICICIGFISVALILLKSRKSEFTPLHRKMKLKFGGWLALALEFQLASDIVKTTISPTWDNLILLGAIAVIRTFLTYFLNRELKEDMEMVNRAAEEKVLLK